MATYFEVKSLINRIVNGKYLEEENDDDIIIDRSQIRYMSSNDNEPLIISNSELSELFEKVSSKQKNNLQLYDENEYEVIVNINRSKIRFRNTPINSEDTENGIKYELSRLTSEYCIYLLMLLKDRINQQDSKYERVQIERFRFVFRYLHGYDDFTLSSFLQRLIGEMSIKITNTANKKIQLDDFKKYKNAFAFDFMYKLAIAFLDFSGIEDLFPINIELEYRQEKMEVNTPPLRLYSEDVVDYYKQALDSNDPYIQFISFYHVMEYFFDEIFKRNVVKDFKDKITNPNFSYKDDDKVYDLAQHIKNKFSSKDNSGQGDEKESLKYVLVEYVPIEDLKQRIESIQPGSITYYQNNKVSFCNATAIPWADSQGVYGKIRDRIYNTRNSLVHSKSGKNFQRYRPYKDEKELQSEIPLVQAIAELIIINTSEIL